jgi:hypothetical protein
MTLREKYDALAATVVKIAVVFAVIFSAHANAQAEGTLIPAQARVDMVYDLARDTVYITNGGAVLRYQIGSNTFLPPFQLGGNLYGIDLSPDGKTLVVADATRTETSVWVHVIDLQTGTSRKASFPRAFLEGGTYSVAFGNDETVLITSTFEGSGWVPMRRYNPRTNAWSEIASVRQSSMVTSSSDGGAVGFEESNISDGAFGRYRLSDGNLLRKSGYTDGTGWFNYEIGVNRNGTQYALPTYGGTFIYDVNLSRVTTVGQYAGAQPIGVVYHPAEDIVYFAWAGSTEVRAHDTNTFAQSAAYNFEYTFTHPGNWGFVHGRLKMSGDGSLLFATVGGGVRYLRLYSPLTANDQSVNVIENTASAVTLTGGVGNGGAVAYSVASGPSHGTLSGAAPNLVYTPESDYTGADSFTFKASYGKASVLATVSISVRAVNAAPVGYDQSVATAEDAAKSITLTGSDADSDPLTFSVVGGPLHGTLAGVAPNLTYTPAPDYYGADSFTFKVNDGRDDSGTATVSIAVNAVNDAPAAAGQYVTTNEDTLKTITLSGSDVDGDALTYVVVSGPAHGALNGSGASRTYAPAADYNGQDSFTFMVNDGAADSNVVTVLINVSAVNDAPVASADAAATRKNTAVNIDVLANDSDVEGDALAVTSVTQAANGTVYIVSGAQVKYTPYSSFVGTDTFTYTVSDGKGGSATATVTVTVNKR